jgi:hypothetical protein
MKKKGLQTKHALKAMRIEREKVGYNLFKQEIIQGFNNQQAFKEYNKVQRRIQKMIRRNRNHSNCPDKKSRKKEKSHNLKKVQDKKE